MTAVNNIVAVAKCMSTVSNSKSAIINDTNNKCSKRLNLKLMWRLVLALLVIACVAFVYKERGELSASRRADVDGIGKEHNQELWIEMRNRFSLLSNDVAQNTTRPTAPWTDRCATSRYRASETVALMLKAQCELANNTAGLSYDENDQVRPENVTQLQQVLGKCGLEFMELITTCPRQISHNGSSNNNNNIETNTTRNTIAIFTLVYAVEQLDQIPEKARVDLSLNTPTWVGINPIKRFLPRKVLDRLQLDPTQDTTTVFFWTTCCGGEDLSTQFINGHQLDSGPELNQLHLEIARNVFGSSYTTELPMQTWSYKGTFLMHHTLLLEFACFCEVFLAHLLDRYVTVARRSSSLGVGNIDSDMESVRPEIFLRFESGDGHTNTMERSWGYLFERLINYWTYNAGYGMIMIHDTAGEQTEQVDHHRGRWQLLQPVTENNLTETQKRLRSCRSMFCSNPRLFSTSVQQQAQCPHLYDGDDDGNSTTM